MPSAYCKSCQRKRFPDPECPRCVLRLAHLQTYEQLPRCCSLGCDAKCTDGPQVGPVPWYCGRCWKEWNAENEAAKRCRKFGSKRKVLANSWTLPSDRKVLADKENWRPEGGGGEKRFHGAIGSPQRQGLCVVQAQVDPPAAPPFCVGAAAPPRKRLHTPPGFECQSRECIAAPSFKTSWAEVQFKHGGTASSQSLFAGEAMLMPVSSGSAAKAWGASS